MEYEYEIITVTSGAAIGFTAANLIPVVQNSVVRRMTYVRCVVVGNPIRIFKTGDTPTTAIGESIPAYTTFYVKKSDAKNFLAIAKSGTAYLQCFYVTGEAVPKEEYIFRSNEVLEELLTRLKVTYIISSLSPSASPSVSPSVSPSASLSPSKSPSLSPSISPSLSPSASASVSPSASASPSQLWHS